MSDFEIELAFEADTAEAQIEALNAAGRANAAAKRAEAAAEAAEGATEGAEAAAQEATDKAAEAGEAAQGATDAAASASSAAKKADDAAASVDASIAKAEGAAASATQAASTADSAASAATASAAEANGAASAASTAAGKADASAAKADASATKADTAATAATDGAAKAEAAAASATGAASTATESAAKADTAAKAATDSAAKADASASKAEAATEGANTAADKANAAAEAVREATIGLSPAQLSAMVKLGTAPTVLPVGTQLYTTLSGNGYNVEQFAWDVVHHFDGSDDDHPLVTLESGKQVKGMMLQAHRTVPWAIVWEPKQAAIAVTGDMPAGTYCFTVKVTAAWGTGIAAAIGETTYQFTTTQALGAGAQLVWSADGYSVKPTAMKLNAYASGASTTIVEACAVSEGGGGTGLGVMTDATPSVNSTDYALLNNIERAVYGSNRWATSQEREALNAATVAQGGTEFSRPWNLVGKAGLPACLPEEFVGVLGKVERKQELHPWDGGEVEATYDTFFPVSAREHGFNNYLTATTAGFKAEGVPLDYWTQLRAASGRTAWNGWNNYPELIAYDSVATTTARSIQIRTAFRSSIYADCVGCVYANGTPSHVSTYYVYYSIPACVII